jgi:UDP-2,3-diacylglucosamine pyrophosphatase LpxH
VHLHADEAGTGAVGIVVDGHAHQAAVDIVNRDVVANDQVDGIPAVGE